MAFAVLLMVLESCTHRLTDFTVISTKNYPVSNNQNVNLQKARERVKGVDCAHMVLCFPIGSPNMKEAIDRAIEKYPGAVGLADGVVKSKYWWAFLYGQNSYIVEGTPIYESDVEKEGYNRGDKTQYHSSDTLLFYHEVEQGETLSSVAKQYGVSVGNIVKWNKLSSNEIAKGTKLKIYVTE